MRAVVFLLVGALLGGGFVWFLTSDAALEPLAAEVRDSLPERVQPKQTVVSQSLETPSSTPPSESSQESASARAPIEDALFSPELLRYASVELRAGWKTVRTEEMPEETLAVELEQFKRQVRRIPSVIGAYAAKELTESETFERGMDEGDPFAILELLDEDGSRGPLVDFVGDRDTFAKLFQRASGEGVVDGRIQAADPDAVVADGVTLAFGPGAHRVKGLMTKRVPFPRDVTLSGAGMDTTLLVLGDLGPNTALVNFAIRDCTVFTDGAPVFDIRGPNATVSLQRVRVTGFDSGAGGSKAFATDGLALSAIDSRFEAGYGRSPQHGRLFDVRTDALLARFDRCRFAFITSSIICATAPPSSSTAARSMRSKTTPRASKRSDGASSCETALTRGWGTSRRPDSTSTTSSQVGAKPRDGRRRPTVSNLRARLDAFRRTHAVRERSVRGDVWRYVIGGAGEHALLLLPGYFVGAESWFDVQERLERSFRVLAVDYAAVETVEMLARGLSALLAAERIETVHLVGQSIGALYAQDLASRSDAFASTTAVERAPRVRSLVLVHGSLPRTADLARVRRGVALGRLAPEFLHRRQWARRIAAERGGDDPTSTFWRELFVERARRLSKRDVVAWGACYRDLLARGELRPADFEPLRGRVLLVESPDDPIVGPAERSALRAFHAGAEVTVLEGAGHFAPERRPAELAAAIEAFVTAP